MKENSNQKKMCPSQARAYFVVQNDRGIHTRPATEIVRLASQFKCDLRLNYRKIEVNARSILGILMLEAGKGARILVKARGDDAEEAILAMKKLASEQFHIKY